MLRSKWYNIYHLCLFLWNSGTIIQRFVADILLDVCVHCCPSFLYCVNHTIGFIGKVTLNLMNWQERLVTYIDPAKFEWHISKRNRLPVNVNNCTTEATLVSGNPLLINLYLRGAQAVLPTGNQEIQIILKYHSQVVRNSVRYCWISNYPGHSIDRIIRFSV